MTPAKGFIFNEIKDLDKTNSFARDVKAGLESVPRSLPSKYFYDDTGSLIFQEIMHMPGYYLTRAEKEIFENHAGDIWRALGISKPIDIIEPGAGDGLKSGVLLRAFLKLNPNLRYFPIDISEEALNQLEARLKKELPELNLVPVLGENVAALNRLSEQYSNTMLILFLGSNIGNYPKEGMLKLLQTFSDDCNTGDMILLGADLKKSPAVILPAYDDAKGITARFNLNLLSRINRELGADFDLKKWKHYANYDEAKGEMNSFLVSREKQEVNIAALNESFHFEMGESIHTEVSRKFSPEELLEMARQFGFKQKACFYDSRMFFTNVIWEKL